MDVVFGPTGHVTWWQECDRALVVFIYGLAIVRIRRQARVRQVGGAGHYRVGHRRLQPEPGAAGQAALGRTLAATTMLIALHWFLAQAAARSPRLAGILEGTPIELGRGGSVDPVTMRRHSVSRRDLDEALRQSGVEEDGKTSRVVLEPSGKIDVPKR